MFYYVTFYVLSLGVLLVRSYSFRQGLLPKEVCETKECQDAAEQIQKWMNPTFKPCDDFYEYSCGHSQNLDNLTDQKPQNSSLGWRNTIVNYHMKNFLLDEDITKETRLFKMLKQFLSLCLDEESIEARGVAPAVEALRKAGGWPVLEQNWSEDNWSIEDTEISFDIGAFFTVKMFLFIDYKWTVQIDVMSPTHSLPMETLSEGFQNETVKEYYKKKCELAEAFGAEKSKAEADMREVLDFEIAMAELTMRLNESNDDVDFTILPHFQEDFSWLNWTYLINSLIPENASVEPDYYIIIMRPNFIQEIGDLIQNYSTRTVANYMMWKAAASLAEYLPAKVRNITEDKNSVNKTRYDRCAEMVKQSSLSGAAVSYIARRSQEDTAAATEMTQNILKEILNDASEIEWIDEETRTSATKKLNETRLLIGYPEEILDVGKLEDLYKDVNVNTSFFFEAVVDSNSWVIKNKFEKFRRNVGLMSLQERVEISLERNAFYIISANTIVVTGEFMHFVPLFSSKMPAYVNYGNLGFIIAHELMHALDFQSERNGPYDRFGDVRGEHLERWYSNETAEIYEEKKQCIIDQYSSFLDSKYTGQHLDGEKTDREDIADNGGLKVALRAYRKVAAKLTPEPRLPTLQQYSPEQLFMISLANSFCRIFDREKMAEQLEKDQHSPHEFRMRGIAMNSPDFSKLFDCANNAPMNPNEKCEVW